MDITAVHFFKDHFSNCIENGFDWVKSGTSQVVIVAGVVTWRKVVAVERGRSGVRYIEEAESMWRKEEEINEG